MLFNPGKIWQDRTVAIIDGGSSFSAAQSRLIGMAHAKGSVRVIAINDAVYPCWYADILYACDAKWWNLHGLLPAFRGSRVRLKHFDSIGRDVNIPSFDGIHHVICGGHEGYDDRPGHVMSGGMSGYQAINLCGHLGVTRILLFGYDMKGKHWFGDHPREIAMSPRLDKFAERFAQLYIETKARGIEVINATPGTALAGFPKMDPAAALEMVK